MKISFSQKKSKDKDQLKKIEIAIFGSFSARSKGDLAILISMIENILKLNRNVDFFIPSKRPEELKKYINHENVTIYKTITAYFGLSTIKYMNKSEILVFGGGGLFFDQKMLNPFFNHIVNLFFLTLINKILFRKKTYLFSVGASHLNSKLGLALTGFILNNVDAITVRDNATFNLFSKLTDKRIDLFYDPAFLLEPSSSKKVDKFVALLPNDKSKIVFCVNDSILRSCKERIVQTLIKLQKKYFVFLCMNIDDQGILDDLFERSDIGSLLTVNRLDYSPQEIIRIFGYFDYVISAPMHASIFAFVANSKLITIDYDDKVKELNNILKSKNNIDLNERDLRMDSLDEKYESDNLIDCGQIRESALKNFLRLVRYANKSAV